MVLYVFLDPAMMNAKHLYKKDGGVVADINWNGGFTTHINEADLMMIEFRNIYAQGEGLKIEEAFEMLNEAGFNNVAAGDDCDQKVYDKIQEIINAYGYYKTSSTPDIPPRPINESAIPNWILKIHWVKRILRVA